MALIWITILTIFSHLTNCKNFQFGATTTTDQIIQKTDAYLRDKLAIITGATSGLGLETTRSLAFIGCKVIMAVRDTNKAEQVKQQIINDIMGNEYRKTTKAALNKNIIIKQLDLDSLQSVLDFAKAFYREYAAHKLNYLFLNAGLMAIPRYSKTRDGFERQMGVNHLGHYYLGRLLINKLAQYGANSNDEPGRMIVVASRAHYYAPQPIENAVDQMERSLKRPHAMKVGYEAWRNYGISKAFNILFARELQRRQSHRNLVTVSLHPGVIKSGLQQYMTEEEIATKTFDKDIKQGTATQLWCALMPIDMVQPGAYYDDCQVHEDRLREDLKEPMEGFVGRKDEEVMDTLEYRLWEISERMITEKGFTFDFFVSEHAQKQDL